MNYAEFIKWINEADINKEYKSALQIAEPINPFVYLDKVRQQLEKMVNDGVVLKYKNLSLGQLHEMLDPSRDAGKKFMASIPANLLVVNTDLQQVLEILANPEKLNQAIKDRDSFAIPKGSDFELSGNYLGYLFSKEFSAKDVYKNNMGRVLGYIAQSFNKSEVRDCGFESQDDVLVNPLMLSQAVALEAAIFAVEADSYKNIQDELLKLSNQPDHVGLEKEMTALMESSHQISKKKRLFGRLEECASLLAETVKTVPEYSAFKNKVTLQQEERNERIATASIPVGGALLALENLYQEVKKQHRTLEDCDDVMQPLLDAYNAKLNFTIEFGGDLEAADASHESLITLMMSLGEKFEHLILDKNFIKFISDVKFSRQIAKTADDKNVKYDVNLMLSEIISLLPLVRAELLFAKYRVDRDAGRLDLSDVEILYDYHQAILAEKKDEGSQDLFGNLKKEYKRLQAEKSSSNGQYKEDLLNLVSELRGFQAQQPAAVVQDDHVSQQDKGKEDDVLPPIKSILSPEHEATFDLLMKVTPPLNDQPGKPVEIIFYPPKRLRVNDAVAVMDNVRQTLPPAELQKNINRFLQRLDPFDWSKAFAALFVLNQSIDKLGPFLPGKISANKKQTVDNGVAIVIDTIRKNKWYPELKVPDLTNMDALLKNGAFLQETIQFAYNSISITHDEDDAKPKIAGISIPSNIMKIIAELLKLNFTNKDIHVDMNAAEKLAPDIEKLINDAPQNIVYLKQACDHYTNNHLKSIIYNGFRDHSHELLWKDEDKSFRFNVDAALAEHKDEIDRISAIDDGFSLAVEKYQKVKAMRSTLEGNQIPVVKLMAFKNNFDDNRHIIEQRRDSGAIKFLKVLATIFTFGIAAAAGIWKVKGKQFTDDISKQLPNDNKPSGNKNK